MSRSVNKLIDEQIKRWELDRQEKESRKKPFTIITISRESGSWGYKVAKQLCKETGFDLFHNEILNAMVEESKNSRVLLETLDERGMNLVDDIVSNFINERHLWPDEYSKLLLKILTTIFKHGNAVILGRGANCVLQDPHTLRVRIVAPLEVRIDNIQKSLDLGRDDALKHIVNLDSNRAAFVKRYFNSDSTDPSNYDLIINTSKIKVEQAVQLIKYTIS